MGYVWNVINSNVVGLVIATVIGVAMASYVQVRQSNHNEERRRKQVALMLGYEIAQMRELAKASVGSNAVLFDEYKKDIERGDRRFLTHTEMLFSRTVYDRDSTDLSLLPPKVVATITDLYRRLEVLNRIQGFAASVSSKGNSLMPNIVGVPDSVYRSAALAPTLAEIDKAIAQFISYTEMNLTNVRGLITVCDRALEGLSKIGKIDQTEVAKVTVVNPDEQATTPSGTPKETTE